MNWIEILGFNPEKKFKSKKSSPKKCFNCGLSKVTRLKSSPFTYKVVCNDCKYYTFIVVNEKMGSSLEDFICIDRREGNL